MKILLRVVFLRERERERERERLIKIMSYSSFGSSSSSGYGSRIRWCERSSSSYGGASEAKQARATIFQ